MICFLFPLKLSCNTKMPPLLGLLEFGAQWILLGKNIIYHCLFDFDAGTYPRWYICVLDILFSGVFSGVFGDLRTLCTMNTNFHGITRERDWERLVVMLLSKSNWYDICLSSIESYWVNIVCLFTKSHKYWSEVGVVNFFSLTSFFSFPTSSYPSNLLKKTAIKWVAKQNPFARIASVAWFSFTKFKSFKFQHYHSVHHPLCSQSVTKGRRLKLGLVFVFELLFSPARRSADSGSVSSGSVALER